MARADRYSAGMDTRAFRLAVASALLYALAFNISFFVQEFFLVLPKALTPGLHPVLYHNNHDWTGHHPLENLFQGTGAAATMVMGALALAAVRRAERPGPRLFLAWLSYHGFLLALPQFVIGAFVPANDVGRAMTWFGLPDAGKWALAALAIAAMLAVARRLAPIFARFGPLWWAATLPALIGTLLVIPFRVPGHPVEVMIVPAFVLLAGVPTMQVLGRGGAIAEPPAPWVPGLALVGLLLVFQFVLRPGIAF